MGSSQDDHLIGHIAVHYKLITRDQLIHATTMQAREGGQRRLGEILLALGFVSREQLDKLLAFQQRQRAEQEQQRRAAAAAQQASVHALEAEVGAAPGGGGYDVAGYDIDDSVGPPAQGAAPSHAGHQHPPQTQPQPPPARQVAPAAPPEPAGATGRAVPMGGPDPAMVEQLNKLLTQAHQMGASDLHVHSGAALTLRVNGVLAQSKGQPLNPEGAQNLVLAALTPQQRERLEDHGHVDTVYTVPGIVRCRVNVYKQQRGMDGTFRLLPAKPPTLQELNLPSSLARFTTYHQGLVLFTGPGGCGKSNTMAAILNILNEERAEHILTVEDPIEILHPRKRCVVNQREVRSHTESFARALRAALREDPDIIAIGELRDLETIQLALTAAETGHLVFATLHTSNAIRSIDRIISAFPANQQAQVRTMLSESLHGVVSQRLVRTKDGRARVPALEILVTTGAIANLIREEKTYQLRDILQTSSRLGMRLLDDSLAELVKTGVIGREEALKNCEDPKKIPGG